MPKQHELKTWPVYFEAVLDGSKTFELRKDDRGFLVGDSLILREWVPANGQYTGRSLTVEVTYKASGVFGLEPGYCALGFDGIDRREGCGECPVCQGDGRCSRSNGPCTYCGGSGNA